MEVSVDGDWRKSTVTPEVLAPPTEASAEPEEEPAAVVAALGAAALIAKGAGALALLMDIPGACTEGVPICVLAES